MVEFRWIIFSLFVMLLFSFTAVIGKPSDVTVRVGSEVILSCKHVIDDQDKCDSTHWIFSDSSKEAKVIELEAKSKSDRLSVTENCSLVIKKVTAEDAGLYDCQQYSKSGDKKGPDSLVHLSVVNVTKHQDNGTMILNCSVSTYEQSCRHTVKWLYDGKDANTDKDMKTSSSKCAVTVTFPAFNLKQKSEYHELFKCEVTDLSTEEVQQFNFSHQSSGDDATPATTKSPTTTKSTSTTRNKWTSVKVSPSEGTNKAATNHGTKQKGRWWIIIVSVGVAALLIITVTVIRWKRTKGNKTQEDENTADPEDGVSYATISFTKKTNSEDRLQGGGDDDDDDDDAFAVTYSTVKVSSSASNDPSNLRSTVKPNK